MRKKILQTAFILTALFSLTFCHGNSSTETNNPKDIYQSAATTQTDAEVTQSETEEEIAPSTSKETKATTKETTAYIPPETMSDPTYPEYKEDYESLGGLDIYFPAGLTGQCTIIRADHRTYLYGTGAPEDAETIINTLHDLGVEEIEQIILPAFSRECVGGLKDIAETFSMEFEYSYYSALLTPYGDSVYHTKGYFEPGLTEKETLWFEELKKVKGLRIIDIKTYPRQITRGDEYTIASITLPFGTIEKITFLTPIGDANRDEWEDKNRMETYGFDYSEYAATCMIEYGDMRILLEGDISGKTESTVLAMNRHELGGKNEYNTLVYSVSEQKKNNLTNIDVLITKAWDESLSKEWLDVIDPASTVVTAVKDDEASYPQSGALSRLKDTGTSLYRPDVQGSLSLHSDGYSITWSKDPCNDFSVGDE